jgi:hypothetical protein
VAGTGLYYYSLLLFTSPSTHLAPVVTACGYCGCGLFLSYCSLAWLLVLNISVSGNNHRMTENGAPTSLSVPVDLLKNHTAFLIFPSDHRPRILRFTVDLGCHIIMIIYDAAHENGAFCFY